MTSNAVEREDHTSTNSNCKESKANDPNERLPHCQRCAQHNLRNRLRGHKAVCPFRECGCQKCVIVVERQRLMADQIKLRRRQRKQRNLHKQRIPTEQSTTSQSTATGQFGIQSTFFAFTPTTVKRLMAPKSTITISKQTNNV
ncbi:DM DNA binding domain protein [Aphelenchoides besseyi]|nr:DM DNA binding domain protein [Aphelenchoides besseyi]